MFGVTTSFVDEEVYTTKLDRSAAGFRERERKAQRIASEILGVRPPTRGYSAVYLKTCLQIWQSTANNPHIAEERNLGLDDSGVNEEDKYTFLFRLTYTSLQHNLGMVRSFVVQMHTSPLVHANNNSSINLVLLELQSSTAHRPKPISPRFLSMALTEQWWLRKKCLRLPNRPLQRRRRRQ